MSGQPCNDAKKSANDPICESKQLRLLIGVTGSVASIKLIPLIQAVISKFEESAANLSVRVVATERATHFFDASTLNSFEPKVELFRDQDEWNEWNRISDPVLHIELRNWANMLLIAPIDANTLAKLANGLCDNLLTCIARAWNMVNPVLIAPAMNTAMWNHPHTSRHLEMVKQLNYEIIPVISKRLACGDVGFGAMAEPESIAQHIFDTAIKTVWKHKN